MSTELQTVTGAEHVYIACGYTDLRCGIDGLAERNRTHRIANRIDAYVLNSNIEYNIIIDF